MANTQQCHQDSDNTCSAAGASLSSAYQSGSGSKRAAHTPAPWTSDRRGTQGIANYTVIGTPANWHREIARVYHGDRFADGEANVRLIAAAPDLLEALEKVISQIDPENTTVGLGNILNARAALAKARATDASVGQDVPTARQPDNQGQ